MPDVNLVACLSQRISLMQFSADLKWHQIVMSEVSLNLYPNPAFAHKECHSQGTIFNSQSKSGRFGLLIAFSMEDIFYYHDDLTLMPATL